MTCSACPDFPAPPGPGPSPASSVPPSPVQLPTTLVLQQQLDAMCDRVTAGYLAMAEKFDIHQKEVLSAIGTQGTAIEKRLDALESAVARLEQRSMFRSSSSSSSASSNSFDL